MAYEPYSTNQPNLIESWAAMLNVWIEYAEQQLIRTIHNTILPIPLYQGRPIALC